jgi:hypothetical protein
MSYEIDMGLSMDVATLSALGSERHLVRRGDVVAIGGIADIARPSQIGRD